MSNWKSKTHQKNADRELGKLLVMDDPIFPKTRGFHGRERRRRTAQQQRIIHWWKEWETKKTSQSI